MYTTYDSQLPAVYKAGPYYDRQTYDDDSLYSMDNSDYFERARPRLPRTDIDEDFGPNPSLHRDDYF